MPSPHALALGSMAAACALLLAVVPKVAPIPTGAIVCVMPDHRQVMREASAELPPKVARAPVYLPGYMVEPVPPGCPADAVFAFSPSR